MIKWEIRDKEKEGQTQMKIFTREVKASNSYGKAVLCFQDGSDKGVHHQDYSSNRFEFDIETKCSE